MKLFRHKLKKMNPKFSPPVQRELQKMVEAGIIEPIGYSSWVSNPVIVRKKIGEMRICVDFKNLNQAFTQGQLYSTKHGVSFAKGHRSRNDVHA